MTANNKYLAADEDRAMIQLKNLAIGYRNRKSVKIVAENINAQIFESELTCLLGANGIGKSTLLRTLSAFQPKLSGEIIINNESINNYSEKELSMLVSVVLTEKPDIKNMTVRSLIALGRSPYTGFWGRLTPRDIAEIDKAITLVGIENLTHRLIHTLSDGERQKTMIAKALAQNTPIIFLDEPTAFLDFPSKVEMMQLLQRLSRETNKTIFLSTHDLELALQIADKIWLMDDDANIHVGTPEDLSLNGCLDGFFSRKGVVFDKDTGLFRVENEIEREIQLIGHCQPYAMIRKALLRNRIYAARDVNSPDSIEVVENGILFRHANGKEVLVNSIEELLKELLR